MAWRASVSIFNRDDARRCVTIEATELPWPMRFYFLPDVEKDEWVDAGHEFGVGRIQPNSPELERDQVEVTPENIRWIEQNLWRYRRLATNALIWDHEGAMRERAAMRKSAQGRASTVEQVLLLDAEREAYVEDGGTISELAVNRGQHRTTIWRQSKKAEKHRPA
jgi:hypothetical protein